MEHPINILAIFLIVIGGITSILELGAVFKAFTRKWVPSMLAHAFLSFIPKVGLLTTGYLIYIENTNAILIAATSMVISTIHSIHSFTYVIPLQFEEVSSYSERYHLHKGLVFFWLSIFLLYLMLVGYLYAI